VDSVRKEIDVIRNAFHEEDCRIFHLGHKRNEEIMKEVLIPHK
jgi:hypothetical protein